MSETEDSGSAAAFLRARTFLGALPDALAERLVALGATRRTGRGEVLFDQGAEGDSLHVILSGMVKIAQVTADGREVVLAFLGPGDILGEIAVLDGGPRTARAEMLEPGRVFVLARADLMPVLEARPEALIEILGVLCERLRVTSATVESLQADTARRVAAGLLRLAELHGRRTREGVRIELPASQQDLGAYLGLSRANTSRELARLSREGVIATARGAILVARMDRLAHLAGQDG